MQITKPTFYKEFSCIAGACPDTCCAGWQIMIDEKSLQKYRRFKGPFRNRLHKVKMAVICTFMIHELAVGTWLKNDRHFTFEDMISICYRFSRELEHSDPNLNEMERLMDEEDVFDFRNLLTI